MSENSAEIRSPQAKLAELHNKLADNHKQSLATSSDSLLEVEIKVRAFAILGQLLQADSTILKYQNELTVIFDEMFADSLISLELAACGLDKPAELVLRRVLELGVAILFLWDRAYDFCAWRSHDKDLSFREMIDHVCSETYATLLVELTGKTTTTLPTAKDIDDIYGQLSDTIHGKLRTFETPLPDRFAFTAAHCVLSP